MRAMIMISSLAMGGTERNIVSVLPYLAAAGLDVVLGSMNTRRDSPLTEDFAKTGVQRLDLGAKRMLDPAAWRRFTQLIRDEQIDIIHAQDQDTIIYAALAHRRLGIPTIMSRHVMVEPADTWKEAARARLLLFMARHGFNRVITVSEAVRQNFSKQAHIPLDKIVTIYNGIPLERFNTRDQRAACRAELGWQADAPVVIMVGVLRRGKGHDILFQAIPKITAAVPDVQIKLVGEGELSDQLRQQAQPFGATVEFMGQRMDVPQLLGASDILILPSWSEALPTVLIEAGAAGLPLVATDVGGSAEIVKDGDTGYIVPPGDPEQFADRLITLLQNPGDARAMGDRAYQRIHSTFSLERQAQQSIALYERVLRER